MNTEEQSLVPWTGTERESFFAAVARHRRAAWRVTVVSAAVNALAIFIVAALMAPLFYAVLALALDLLNLIVPMPNLVSVLGRYVGPAFDAPETVSIAGWVVLLLVAALPGLLCLGIFMLVLRRAIRLSGLFSGGDITARAPAPRVLAEQRFANTVGEMAIAANLPPPRVLVTDQSGMNGAVFGVDDEHVTVVVSRGLLEALNREQIQGVAAHLVGSIANGDMKIGVRVATTFGLFGLISRMAGVLMEGRAARQLLKHLAVAVIRPTARGTRGLLEELSDPMRPEPAEGAPAKSSNQNDWRTYLWMPLVGPIGMTGFFGAVVDMFLLEPLISLAWRRRKYMADATAVRLTRLPDGLSAALERMGAGAPALFGAWAAHLQVVRGLSRGSMMSTSFVPPFPSVNRRLRALAQMGAYVRSVPEHSMPLVTILIITPLAVIATLLAGVLMYMLVMVSMMLSMVFLGLPFGLIHVFLRWVGH